MNTTSMARWTPRGKSRWKLYWVVTGDETEDWFVVARDARTAARFHEEYNGFATGDAYAAPVVALPPAFGIDAVEYADEDLLRTCGAELLRSETPRAVRLRGRVFVEGALQHVINTQVDDFFEACGKGRPNGTGRAALPS
jgi:hypothetical protein